MDHYVGVNIGDSEAFLKSDVLWLYYRFGFDCPYVLFCFLMITHEEKITYHR
jgi:hypothetical protein